MLDRQTAFHRWLGGVLPRFSVAVLFRLCYSYLYLYLSIVENLAPTSVAHEPGHRCCDDLGPGCQGNNVSMFPILKDFTTTVPMFHSRLPLLVSLRLPRVGQEAQCINRTSKNILIKYMQTMVQGYQPSLGNKRKSGCDI